MSRMMFAKMIRALADGTRGVASGVMLLALLGALGCGLGGCGPQPPQDSTERCPAECSVCDMSASPFRCIDGGPGDDPDTGPPPPQPPDACADEPPCGAHEVRNPSTCACDCEMGYRYYDGDEGEPGCVPEQRCEDGISCPEPSICQNEPERRSGYACVCPAGWMETAAGCEMLPVHDVCEGFWCP